MVEPLPCFVLVGEDVECRFLLCTQVPQKLHIFGFQQGGAGDGDGFPSRGEQGEAVCHSFREPKPFARSQSVHHGQTEDAALRTAGETEPWHACLMAQIAALDVHQPARAVAVGKEQRGGIVVGFPVPPARGGFRYGCDAQPLHHRRMDATLAEEEFAGFGIQYGMLHQAAEVLHIGRKFLLRLLGGLPFGEYHVVLVGQPSAGFREGLAGHFHHEGDGAAVGIAYKALVGVPFHVEGQRGVAVGMEGT